MSIRFKLILGFGLLVALSCALAFLAVQRVTALGHMVVDVYDRPLMSISHARAAQAGFAQARTMLSAAADRPDAGMKAAADQLRATMGDIASDLNVVAERTSSDDVQQALAKVRAGIGEWQSQALERLAPARPLESLPAPWVGDRKADAVSSQMEDLVQQVAADGFTFRTNAEAQIAAANRLLTWSAGAVAVLGLLLALFFARFLGRPIVMMRDGVKKMLAGESVTLHAARRRDEIGQLARSFAEIYEKAVEASRIRAALDGCATSVLATDPDGRVVYANAAMQALAGRNPGVFARADLAGEPLATALPLGSAEPSIDVAMLRQPAMARLSTGRLHLDLAASPVFAPDGTRLGTVLEARDVSATLEAEAELRELTSAMAAAAAAGDFSRRIPLEGKDGMMRDVADSVNRIGEIVERITEDLERALGAMSRADLTQTIERDYSGRFAALKDSVNGTVGRLAEIMDTIKSTAVEVTATAREISGGADDLSGRTEQQASSLEETAATAEQLAASVKASAQSSRLAVDLSRKAMDVAAAGGSTIRQAVDAMERIEQASARISDITGVIDEIAFQTNLLALNAAVEAARAGEAGKGFAVVASEVRTLAQRSSEAAKDITGLITTSVNEVSDGVRLVRAAGQSLGEIVAASQRVTDTVSEISSATGEQANGIDEMSQAVAHMDDMTQQNAALAEESAASAAALTSLIERLNDLVSAFRTGHGAPIASPPSHAAPPQPPRPAPAPVKRAVSPAVPAARKAKVEPPSGASLQRLRAMAEESFQPPAAPRRKAVGAEGWEEF